MIEAPNLNSSQGFTLIIRRKSLFNVQNSIDPWGVSPFTHLTLVSLPLWRLSGVHGSDDNNPQRYRAARFIALPLTPHERVATPRGGAVLWEDRPSSDR
jgi:hypothetical protein